MMKCFNDSVNAEHHGYGGIPYLVLGVEEYVSKNLTLCLLWVKPRIRI